MTLKKQSSLLSQEYLAKNTPDYGDPETSLKQIYLQTLSLIEEKLDKEYVQVHDQLIKEIREEDYEKRLNFLFNHEKLSDVWKDGEGKKLMSHQLRHCPQSLFQNF